MRGVPRGPLNGCPDGLLSGLIDRGRRQQHRRVPRQPRGEGHARPGRPAELRQASRAGLRREEVASLAGVSADYYRRLERGHVSGVSELVLESWRARSSSTRPSARTCSTSPAPRARWRRGARARPGSRSGQRAAPARPDRGGRRSSATSRRLPGRQRARPRAVRAGVREPRAAGEQRAVHVPRPGGARLLSRLGSAGLRARRGAALARRPQPARPRPPRPHRRAVHPQRRVPRPLGGAQRPVPPHGHASASTTRSSASSSSATRRSRSTPTTACAWRSTPPSRARHPSRPSTCWPAGRATRPTPPRDQRCRPTAPAH